MSFRQFILIQMYYRYSKLNIFTNLEDEMEKFKGIRILDS